VGGGNAAHDVTMHGIFWEGDIKENFIGHQCSEIYKEGVYNPYFLGKKDLVVVDVGANLGITSYFFSQYAKIVFAVEPSLEHFEVLVHMVNYNNLKNVIPIKQAISLKSGKAKLGHHKNRTMYSLHDVITKDAPSSEEVECVTIDQLFENNKITNCDFLKVDIEGTETEIVSSQGFRKIAPKVDTVFLETHAWSGRHPKQI